MKDGPHALKEAAVEGFGDSVVLRGVMSGEAPFGALLFKEFGEVVAAVFSAAIRPKDFNFHVVLIVRPLCKGALRVQSFVLGPKSVDPSVAREVICVSDVEAAAPKTSDRRRAPKVGVNFGPKEFGRRSTAFTPNSLASHFGVLAGIADDGRAVVNKGDALNGIVTDESTDGIG